MLSAASLKTEWMEQVRRLTALIEREDGAYVALCPEFDIASQGSTIEEARANLIEALTLFFETAERDEIQRRGRSGLFVTK
jgi:predicted RNase H-like HicB family nuclease